MVEKVVYEGGCCIMIEMDGLRKVVYDGMYICGGGERERE